MKFLKSETRSFIAVPKLNRAIAKAATLLKATLHYKARLGSRNFSQNLRRGIGPVEADDFCPTPASIDKNATTRTNAKQTNNKQTTKSIKQTKLIANKQS